MRERQTERSADVAAPAARETAARPGPGAGGLRDVVAEVVASGAGNQAVVRLVQRMAAAGDGGGPAPDGFAERLRAGQGGGRPIPAEPRQRLETGTGAALSDVRVHDDDRAARLAGEVDAHAFTVGRHIYFDQGRYDPDSAAGFRLLAHEVAHTVQQAGATGTPAGPIAVGAPDAAAEHAADRVAAGLVGAGGLGGAGGVGGVGTPEPAPTVRREPSDPPTGERVPIDRALRSRDPGDVKNIHDYRQATEAERLALIGILLGQGWVGPLDEYALEELWRSFGDRLPAVASANMPLWQQCIDRGAELSKLPQVAALQERFVADVKSVVTGYLFQNRQLAMNELERLGLPLDGNAPLPAATPDQTAQIRELQLAAEGAAKIQKAQEESRRVYVGYELSQPAEGIPAWIPVTFDPYAPPPFDSAGGPLMPVLKVTTVPYAEVRKKYDDATASLNNLLVRFPTLFGLLRAGSSEVTAGFAAQTDPQQARRQLAGGMREVIAAIEGTQRKLDGGDLEPLDLQPIHEQLFQGRAAGSARWGDPLPQWAAQQRIGDHEFNQALLAVGLQTASAALFMLAPLTGGASLLMMLGGLAVTGAKFYLSEQQYENLAQAAGTNVNPDSQLVRPQQVETAELVRDADAVALALAALAVGTAAAGEAIGAIRAAPAEPVPPAGADPAAAPVPGSLNDVYGPEYDFTKTDPMRDPAVYPNIVKIRQMALESLADSGPNQPVKVVPLRYDPAAEVKGNFTQAKFVLGRTPEELAKELGVAEFDKGVRIYRLDRGSITVDNMDLRGYSQSPAGKSPSLQTPANLAKWPVGQGAPQWDLNKPVPVTSTTEVRPGTPAHF